MEPPPPPATSSATTSTAQPSESTQSPQPPPPASSSTPSLPPLSTTATLTSTPIPSPQNPNPNPNPSVNPKPFTPQSALQPQPRPPSFPRTWQNQPHFPNFSSLPSSSASASSGPSLSSSASPSIPVATTPRAGIAIGVPAGHPSPSPQPSPFSSSFGQQFGGLGRSSVNVPEPVSSSSASQVKPAIQGMHGMMGSLGSNSQMRPGGIPALHQQRPVQSSLRPSSTPNNQSPATQNFQGHGLLRVSSMGSPGTPSPNTSQSMQSINQPWLSSGSQGKPPLPSPSYRAQMNSQSLQQRSHISQQHLHSSSTSSQQQHMASGQSQQSLPSHQPQEPYGQQFQPMRAPQSLSHQQPISRVPGTGNQKAPSHAMIQPNAVQLGAHNRNTAAESDESNSRILSKRSIQDLVNQIDPLERLDPEVEDILVDIVDEFVESITTFGCSLAKHRKSNTLEAKDILLHLERNWNMTLPGFSGDEIKAFKKPLTNDIHRERLAAIKKSVVSSETASGRNLSGQAVGNTKGNMTKMPANVINSNLK